MKKSLSLASVSTRAPGSTNSVQELSVRSEEPLAAKRQGKERSQSVSASAVVPRGPAPSYRRAAFVAVLAAAAWLLWQRYLNRILRRSSTWGSGRLALSLASGLSSLFGFMGIRSRSQIADDPRSCAPERHKLIVFHPHGCYVLGGITNVGQEPRNKQSGFYEVFVGAADVLFKVPLVREFLLLINARPANPKMMEALLAQGKSVALCPGGIHEQMATDPMHEQLFFPSNLGFVRQAMKFGVPLLPVYTFGENQLYDVPDWSRKLSKKIRNATGAGIPLAVGRWGLPLIPKKVDLETCVGRLVETGPADSMPTDARVREVFLAYCRALRHLFEEKKGALPPAVSDRGLTLVWRGHEAEDLSAAGLSGPKPQAALRLHRIQSAPAMQMSRL